MDHSLVYYYVPEDYDDQEVLNAFGVNKGVNEVTLKDIRDNFPMEGNYHFRFKCTVSKIPVWLDVPNERERVPHFNSKIIMKATRISWGEEKAAQVQAPIKQESLLGLDEGHNNRTNHDQFNFQIFY